MEVYRKSSDGKKSALIGIIIIGISFSVLFINANIRKQKLESDFIWTEATITEIRLNVSKGTTQTKDIFLFEYNHNGKIIRKTKQTYKPELLKVGQKFKIKVHRTDPELVGFESDGT